MSTRPSTVPSRGPSGRGAHSGSEGLAKGLAYFSIGLGLVELLAPRRLARAFGMEGKENLIRAYGVREAMTGIAILASHDPTPWILGRVAGDALDLATLAHDPPRNETQRANRKTATLAVAGVTILDMACAYGLSSDKRLASPGTYDYGDRSGFPRPPRAMRGAASDFATPADFRVPEQLRPWTERAPPRIAGVAKPDGGPARAGPALIGS